MEATNHPGDASGHRVDPRIVASGRAAMVYDAALPASPTWDWFDHSWWATRQQVVTSEGGRGGVAFLETPVGACVLRHYRRGGLMAPLMGDRYVWNGRTHSRGFAEFRLLARLYMCGLPVPAPIAARYQRRGPYYTADIIVRTIAAAQTLTEVIEAGHFDGELAAQVGALVARFHAANVDHADLNAHNILVSDGELWLIDFDRGEVRATGTAWKLSNLARLKRSLLKVGACDRDERTLDRDIWRPLMHGYARILGAR